jgi:hypothetical protein
MYVSTGTQINCHLQPHRVTFGTGSQARPTVSNTTLSSASRAVTPDQTTN